MPQPDPSSLPRGQTRRRVLQSTVVGTTLALAGCTSLPGTGKGDGASSKPPLPEYARWIGGRDIPEADGGDSVGFIRTDFDGLSKLSEVEPTEGTSLGADLSEAEQQFVGLPVYVSALYMIVLGLGLLPYGSLAQKAFSGSTLGGLGSETTTTDSPSQTTTDGLLVGESIVLVGEYDTEALLADLSGFERHSERDGYEIYVGSGSDSFIDTSGYAFAVSDTAVIFSMPDSGSETTTTTTADGEDPAAKNLEALAHRIDVVTGAEKRAAETSPGLDHALRAAGDAMFAFGGVQATDVSLGPESAQSDGEFEAITQITQDAAVLVMGTSLQAQQKATSTFSAQYRSEDAVPERSTFEEFVASADSSSIVLEGRFGDVTGSWSGLRGTSSSS